MILRTHTQKPRWPDDCRNLTIQPKVHFSPGKNISFGFGWFGSFGVSDDPIKVPITKSPRSLHGELLFLSVPIAIYLACFLASQLKWRRISNASLCFGHTINPMLDKTDKRVKLPDQKGSSFLFFKCYLSKTLEKEYHMSQKSHNIAQTFKIKIPPKHFGGLILPTSFLWQNRSFYSPVRPPVRSPNSWATTSLVLLAAFHLLFDRFREPRAAEPQLWRFLEVTMGSHPRPRWLGIEMLQNAEDMFF